MITFAFFVFFAKNVYTFHHNSTILKPCIIMNVHRLSIFHSVKIKLSLISNVCVNHSFPPYKLPGMERRHHPLPGMESDHYLGMEWGHASNDVVPSLHTYTHPFPQAHAEREAKGSCEWITLCSSTVEPR